MNLWRANHHDGDALLSGSLVPAVCADSLANIAASDVGLAGTASGLVPVMDWFLGREMHFDGGDGGCEAAPAGSGGRAGAGHKGTCAQPGGEQEEAVPVGLHKTGRGWGELLLQSVLAAQ